MSREPPDDLRTEGQRLWREMVEGVAPGWELDAGDYVVLEEMCRARDANHRLQRRIDREGVEVAGSKGQPVAHPLLGEVRQNRALIVAGAKRVELAPPKARTSHLDRAGRNQLRDARANRWR